MNRRFLMASLAAATALGLAACSSSSSKSSAPPSSAGPTSAPSSSSGAGASSPQTLTVQTTAYYEPLERAVGTQLEAANPGLKITYQQVSAQQETSTNLQVLTSSSAPDIADTPINGNVY